MAFERELAAALQAAQLASEFLVAEYARFQAIPDAPSDISTEADRTSQEIILEALGRQFPHDAFCAEEQTTRGPKLVTTGARLWIIDPIDGTRGFARKNGEFSVMIGFVKDGLLGVGVVSEPARNRLTYAGQGAGCWRRDGAGESAVACRVSTIADLALARLTQTHSRRHDVPSPAAAALRPAEIIESYSAGIKLALVARGEADLYANDYRAFHDWDICAGHILVSEAGGMVSGLHGEMLTYGKPAAEQRHGLLASNGLLHADAIKRLASMAPN
jgi:3'(2'), 5'-bisphosphate nucleotidase